MRILYMGGARNGLTPTEEGARKSRGWDAAKTGEEGERLASARLLHTVALA